MAMARGVSGGLHDATMPFEVDVLTGLAVGPRVDLPPAVLPSRGPLEGTYCRLEPLETRHAQDLYDASTPPDAAARFRYLFDEPPADVSSMEKWIGEKTGDPAYSYFAVVDKQTGRCEGRQSLMRADVAQRSIENGNVYYGPRIAGSAVSTEANYLLARYVFSLGYRRYEWKCDALNAKSRRAAERYGFRYEGHFRRALVVKNRSRDTAWFSIIAEEWPALEAAYRAWLDPANFDAEGKQRTRLSELTRSALAGMECATEV